MSSSSDTNPQEPPSKKKKKTEPITNPSLPDDLVISCLSRISRLYYPNLSLVSKSFRSILASPELYKTRSLLNRTESCLYVCLQYPSEPNPRWFTLCRKPDKSLKNHNISQKKKKEKETSGYVLSKIPILNSPSNEWSSLIPVGHNLYAICGDTDDAPCSNVSFLDCRTHTWLEAPSLRVFGAPSRINGKLYLPGSDEDPASLNCIEVFDTKTQTWNPVPPEKRILKVEKMMEGKFYIVTESTNGKFGFAIQLKELSGDMVGINSDLHCMIENIIYSYSSSGGIRWSGSSGCRRVEGLEGLPKFAHYSSVRLVNYGDKLLVLWDKYVPSSGYKEKMIWCAEISLEIRSEEEIWGHVKWFDAVLRVPKSYKLLDAIAATL